MLRGGGGADGARRAAAMEVEELWSRAMAQLLQLAMARRLYMGDPGGRGGEPCWILRRNSKVRMVSQCGDASRGPRDRALWLHGERPERPSCTTTR
jgi:hypothetical protein